MHTPCKSRKRGNRLHLKNKQKSKEDVVAMNHKVKVHQMRIFASSCGGAHNRRLFN